MAENEVQTNQSESTNPTGELIYEPERPGRRRTRKPRPPLAYRKPDKTGPSSAEQAGEGDVEEPDLDETFQYRIDDGRNDERALRAASFLLDWATAEGNEEVDPALVQGISRALKLAADNMARDFSRRAKEQQQET